MGYAPRDLDEYSRFELYQELARREKVLHDGVCCYCNRSGLTNPCKFPERHEVARGQAIRLGHKLCGKTGCDKLAVHVANGSLTYQACEGHNEEIQKLVASEFNIRGTQTGRFPGTLRNTVEAGNTVPTLDTQDRGRFG